MQAVTLHPGDVVFNEGNTFGEILRIDRTTGQIAHVASGELLKSSQSSMAFDAQGRLLVVAQSGLVRVDPSSGAQTLLSSGGILYSPKGVTVESNGAIIVTTLGTTGVPAAVVRVDPDTGAQSVVSSGGLLVRPFRVTVDAAGDLIVSDSKGFGGSGGVLRVDPVTGAQAPISSGGYLTNAGDLTIDDQGFLIVGFASPPFPGCETYAGSGIVRVDPDTGAQALITTNGLLCTYISLTVDVDGTYLVGGVFDNYAPGRIMRVDPDTGAQTFVVYTMDTPNDLLIVPGSITSLPPACGDGQINQVTEQCDVMETGACPGPCDADCTCFDGLRPGDVVVVDRELRAVVRVDPATGDRTILSSASRGAGTPFEIPRGLEVLSDGRMVVTDSYLGIIFNVDPVSGDRTVLASASVGSGPILYRPWDLSLEPGGALVVNDTNLDGVFRIDSGTGDRTVVSSSTQGTGPAFANASDGLTTAPDGRIFIANDEFPNSKVLQIDPVSGNRSNVSASLHDPGQLAMEADGHVLVAIAGNGGGDYSYLYRLDPSTGSGSIVSGCNSAPNPVVCSSVGSGTSMFYPFGAAVEADGRILVTDAYADLLFRVDPVSGDRTVLAGPGVGGGPELLSPWAVEIVPADLDSDGDGILDDGEGSGDVDDNRCAGGATAGCDDNCRHVANAGQDDADGDAVGDLCDNCPGAINPAQENFDGDGEGNACDADDDNDGLSDAVETGTGIYVSPDDTGSDPFNADTDNDSYSDGTEVVAGSDPTDPLSFPGGMVPALSLPGVGLFLLLLLGALGWRRRRARP